MSDTPGRAWNHLTSDELAHAIESDPVVVLPTAAIEQHGPHLPLSTDVDIGMGIVSEAFRRLDDALPVLLLPCLAPGASPEHGGTPGTLDLDPRTFERVLVDVGEALARSGVRRLVIANSHGGNRAAIDTAALRLRRRHRMLVVKAHWFRFPRPDGVELSEDEWTHGLHGGAVETAMMLHLHPDRVRSERIENFPSLGRELEDDLTHLLPEGTAAFAWMARDLGPRGVIGDATLATPEMGRRLVRSYGRVLAEIVEDARRFPMERLETDEPA